MSILMRRSSDFDASELLELGSRTRCNHVYNAGRRVASHTCLYISDEGNCFGINRVLKSLNLRLLKSVFSELGIRSSLGIAISSTHSLGGQMQASCPQVSCQALLGTPALWPQE